MDNTILVAIAETISTASIWFLGGLVALGCVLRAMVTLVERLD